MYIPTTEMSPPNLEAALIAERLEAWSSPEAFTSARTSEDAARTRDENARNILRKSLIIFEGNSKQNCSKIITLR